jgi:outer membrane protein assembly factor BamA
VDSERDSIDFQISVRERKPRWLDAGIGSGTAERYRIIGEWGHRNLFRRGLQGALGARLAANGSGQFLLARGEASLLAPWMFGRRIRGVVTPFYERADDRTDPKWLNEQHFRGVRFELRRELNRFSRLVLTQDNVWVRQSLTQFADTLHPDTVAAKKASIVPNYSTHSIALGGEWDYRDNPFNPLNGSYHAATIEVAGGPLQGTSSFRKISAVSSWYMPVRGWVLATRIHAGVMEPTGTAPAFSPPGTGDIDVDPTVARVPSEDRFKAGGVNSIRGYGDNRIPPGGGLAMIVANAELRIPVAGPLGIEAYLDLGNVWARPEYLKGSDFVPSINRTPLDANDVRYVVGIGPRLNLPIGPVRFDMTWGLRPPPQQGGDDRFLGFQFAIGPSF